MEIHESEDFKFYGRRLGKIILKNENFNWDCLGLQNWDGLAISPRVISSVKDWQPTSTLLAPKPGRSIHSGPHVHSLSIHQLGDIYILNSGH